MNYIVVGGGPSGIFTSLLLSLSGNKVTLFEKNNVIGGCHRVNRPNGYFSEHGPRIYVTNYFYYSQILEICNTNFEDNFTDYKYDFIVGVKGAIDAMSLLELIQFAFKFLQFTINPSQFENVSVKETFKGFSKKAMNYIDKMCTLTDGATASNYTAHSFFNIFDQNALYKIVEPKAANDTWLWPAVTKKLTELGVNIIHEKVDKILHDSNKVIGIQTSNQIYYSDAVVVSLPPWHASKLFNNSSDLIANSFLEKSLWSKYVKNNTYIPYLSFTVHFDKKIDLPNVWGNGFGSWGVAWIVMSDYFNDSESPTLISALIVDLDTKSSNTGLTANETIDSNMLLEEAYLQIKDALQIKTSLKPRLILNSGVSRVNNKWTTDDLPFMRTSDTKYLSPFTVNNTKDLYWVGPHNGNNRYAFTSMESVCENVVSFCTKLHPELGKKFKNKQLYTISGIIRSIFALQIIALVIILVIYLIM